MCVWHIFRTRQLKKIIPSFQIAIASSSDKCVLFFAYVNTTLWITLVPKQHINQIDSNFHSNIKCIRVKKDYPELSAF